MVVHSANHLWMFLTALALLGKGSEATINQHLIPPEKRKAV